MSSLDGKIKASLVSAAQETTLALASINFDFSLYKVEAPKEYQALGNSLSKRRRDAAEGGSEHIFARKLGALFAQCTPNTPNLIRAYGMRTSEIAASPVASMKGARENGIFQDWAGADATSIWAAATSGHGALAVHLLACILARVWSPPEAVAIWDELIRTRKHELSKLDGSDPMHLQMLAAAATEITQDQMARWDASARSWLSVADETKRREQIQMTLLVKNLGLSISNDEDVYTSVMHAWRSSMETMESIVKGRPQSISDGAALLGLLSWHLYPDIYALGAQSKHVFLKDGLIPSTAIVTLGALSSSPDSEGGIQWSLPLAYLRYYGEPVRTSSKISDGFTRIPMQDCFYVVLGSILSGWGRTGDDFELACALVIELARFVYADEAFTISKSASWLQHLANTADTFILSKDSQREYYRRLISKGQRRHTDLLSDQGTSDHALFGIGTIREALSLCDNLESRLAVLRLVAEKTELDADTLLIRYSSSNSKNPDVQDVDLLMFDEYIEDDPTANDTASQPLIRTIRSAADNVDWGYATAVKKGHNPRKRKFEAYRDMTGHARWARSPSGYSTWFGEQFGYLDQASSYIATSAEFDLGSTTDDLFSSTLGYRHVSYDFLVGDPAQAAIFKRHDINTVASNRLTLDVLIPMLQRNLLNYRRVMKRISTLGKPFGGYPWSYSNALSALAAAANVYQLMPGASIDTGVLTQPVLEGLWVPLSAYKDMYSKLAFLEPLELELEIGVDPVLQGLYTCMLSREQAFACIAMFENVNINLDPKALSQVMALSSGNSIYVAMPLTCDPFEQPQGYEMKHILGNIGKPGLNLMIPPAVPMIRKVDESKWASVNHFEFEGKLDDCFQHTSLHLSFTRYQMPVGSTSHGNQTVEAFFVETLVSVYDRGEWVADLDVLGALSKECIVRMDRAEDCEHKGLGRPAFKLASIDSWEEYLDRPLGHAIFRCCGNWLARLAITAMNASSGHWTFLFKDQDAVCWQCIARERETSSDTSLAACDILPKATLFIC